jgi:hypothetical protein
MNGSKGDTRPVTADSESGAWNVALREIRFGRVWRANAYRLVEERDDLLVRESDAGASGPH